MMKTKDFIKEGNAFSEDELKAIWKFENEHSDCYRKVKEGRWSFTIKQGATGIGNNTFITCDCCGETKDITDYNVW